MRNMAIEKIELDEDEIAKALNRRLDEDAKAASAEAALDKEVDKRVEAKRKAEEKHRKEGEVHEATFTDETKDKKMKVREKTKVQCATCGSTDMEKISDDEDTYFYKKQNIKAVYRCNGCGKRTGVTE